MKKVLQDEIFMKEALAEARRALSENVYPVGAIVVYRGEIIARGRTSVDREIKLNHAEMKALRKAFEIKKFSWGDGLKIYTTLEPCVMCMGAILNCRVERVVYALEDPFGGAVGHFTEKNVPVRHQGKYPEVIGGVLREDARQILCKYLKDPQDEFWKTNRDNPLVKLCEQQ